MAIVNYATRETQFKLVFSGPPAAGKTTMLEFLRASLDADCGEIVTRKTGMDRTLVLEFVPRGLALLDGFQARVGLYAVPGEVASNAARQLALRDADGIIFVADSRWERMEENASSLALLEKNLAKQDLALGGIPHVLAYNKRDLTDLAPVRYLDYVLNNRERRTRAFETSATAGTNVIAALNAVGGLMVERFVSERPSVPREPAAEAAA